MCTCPQDGDSAYHVSCKQVFILVFNGFTWGKKFHGLGFDVEDRLNHHIDIGPQVGFSFNILPILAS